MGYASISDAESIQFISLELQWSLDLLVEFNRIQVNSVLVFDAF